MSEFYRNSQHNNFALIIQVGIYAIIPTTCDSRPEGYESIIHLETQGEYHFN